MTFLEDVIERVRAHDAARPRSVQVKPGWSEVGGCRAYLGFRLDEAWATDEPDTWAAIRGTAIHEYLQAILGDVGTWVEVDTEYRGIPGHADLVISQDSVTDIKTTRKANSGLWREKPAVLWEKRVQVHGYAAGLIDTGRLPAHAKVRLLVVPVDGTFADWWVFEEPFDRAVADWGADRLEGVQRAKAAGEELPKDKPYAYCMDWCRFFTACRGADDAQAPEDITDPEAAAAVAAYAEARDDEKAAAKRKESFASLIRGLRGTAGDWRISLGRPGEPSWELDEEWVRADYAARGEDVPVVEKAGSAPRLSVTRIKRKAGAGE